MQKNSRILILFGNEKRLRKGLKSACGVSDVARLPSPCGASGS
jgi:hypothetical protein